MTKYRELVEVKKQMKPFFHLGKFSAAPTEKQPLNGKVPEIRLR